MRTSLLLKKLVAFSLIVWACHSGAMGQKIVYNFGPEVIDTFKKWDQTL